MSSSSRKRLRCSPMRYSPLVMPLSRTSASPGASGILPSRSSKRSRFLSASSTLVTLTFPADERL